LKREAETSIPKDSEVSPDGTIFYDFDKAKEAFARIEGKKFTVADSILLLLYSYPEKPIFGRILLMKEVFLLVKEILNESETQDARFVPYYYGMYSFLVTSVINNLEFCRYVEVKGTRNSKLERFCITNKGCKHISRLYDSLPEETRVKIREKRKGWDQLGYEGILRLVYQKYPKFKEASKIKERYKRIEWGRGVG
jgi:hypothetical protein